MGSSGGGMGWCSVELSLNEWGWGQGRASRVPEQAGRGMGHSTRAAG